MCSSKVWFPVSFTENLHKPNKQVKAPVLEKQKLESHFSVLAVSLIHHFCHVTVSV